MLPVRTWWKDAIAYQVYPSSFKDSDGDGLGDLKGITSKLDYIKDLGTDVIWVSPMYKSPQVDMGYDISDYTDVHAPFGTLEDMGDLIRQTHDRGMKIILDLVINHTSDQHKWFLESRSSKDNPKRDWYIWRPAKYDDKGNRMPPGNWRSNFSQPAWTWDEQSQEYYLHLFCPEQPDLNWESATCRKAIYEDALHFWLRRGVDGFRVDTVNMYSKGEILDAPITDPHNAHQPAADLYCNGPRMHEFLREINDDVLSKYGDVMTVGELPNTPDMAHVLRYVSSSDPQLSMVFSFDIVDLGGGIPQGKPKYEYTPFTLSKFKDVWRRLQQFTTGTEGWSTAFTENHDQGRSVSKYGDDSPQWRTLSAKVLATMLATFTGTLFLYQGQEIGMINVPKSWPLKEFIDIEATNWKNLVKEQRKTDKDADLEDVRKALQILARDNARTPMQWDETANAGFSPQGAKEPWMRINDSYREINVAAQEHDPESVLSYWKAMIRMRKQYLDVFAHGKFDLHDASNDATFVYTKTAQDESRLGALVALNFTSAEQLLGTPAGLEGTFECIACNYGVKGRMETPAVGDGLRAWEARVYLIKRS